MAEIFPHIHAFVMRWEGGYINHKNDPGGATNYGVSLRWLESVGYDVNGDGFINVQDIKDLTQAAACGLYRQFFWDAPKLGTLPDLVAALIYDGSVNMGIPRAVKQLQNACNLLQGGSLLRADGVCGPGTASRVHQVCSDTNNSLVLCRMVLDQREEYYRQLASREPVWRGNKLIDYKPFLKGWLNRTAALWLWLQEAAGKTAGAAE